MNKSQLIDAVAEKSQLKKGEAERALDAFIEIVGQTIKDDHEVRLFGFGTFSAATRKSRTGRNPRTGEEIQIPEKKVPVFKPGKELKEILV